MFSLIELVQAVQHPVGFSATRSWLPELRWQVWFSVDARSVGHTHTVRS